MQWIYDFLSRFADFLNYAVWVVRDFLRDVLVFVTQLFQDVWNTYIVGWWYQYSLADVLPDPGLSALGQFVHRAAPYTYTLYAIFDYICYASVVWQLVVLYLQVGLVALVYRTWMLVKRAIPVVG